MLKKTAKLAAAAVIACGIGIADGKAGPILGGSAVVASDGHVIATFIGQTAAHDSTIYVMAPDLTTVLVGPFFHNHLSTPGDMVDLGYYTAGTELIFRLNNLTTGYKYFSGPASRNPDSVAHAIVDDTAIASEVKVGFEDLYGGGDKDYDDNVFSFTNLTVTDVPPTAAPEPGTLAVFGLGLAGLGIVNRKRKRSA